MKNNDLKNIKDWYSEYRSLLFNDDLPDVNKVDFKLHQFTYAAGYSAYLENPKSKSGNNHVIAFCKLFTFSEREIKEILIHEMIHLWQDYHVKHERYKICTNDIAHDRVFKTKMNTINLILKREILDLKITEVCDYDLKLDDSVKSPKKYNIILFKINNNSYIIKCTDKYVNKIKNDIISDSRVSNVYSLISNDVIFMFFKSAKNINYFQSSCQLKNYTNDSIYQKYMQYGKREK